MKKYGGVNVYIHVFLASALVGGGSSASRPGPFTPRYPLDRGLDGPQGRSGRYVNNANNEGVTERILLGLTGQQNVYTAADKNTW
jgi:hypothetical protein